MTYLDFLEQKVLLERLVIGLEEPVLIKGLGELSAKIDSGNGGYNVIHGTDFHQQGNELMFTTHDSFGHEKKIQAKVIDTIEVNMGGGNIENRPVIELDIKFAGDDYKKIPFSVSDRSTNTNPILISKGFVENELEALIDVGAKNISNDGIDVVYGESVILDEGVLGAIGKGIAGAAKGVGAVAKGAVKTAGDIKRGMQTVGNAYNRTMGGIANFGKWLGGDAKMSDWTPSAKGIKDTVKQFAMGALSATGIRSIWKLAARLKNGISLNSEDPKQIVKKFKESKDIPKFFQDHGATEGTIFSDGNNQDISPDQIIPIFNFSFQKGKIGSKNYVKGMEKQAKKYKAAINKAKEGVQSRQKDIDDKNLADEAAGAKKQQDDLNNWNKNKEDFNKFQKWKSMNQNDNQQNNQTQQNASFEFDYDFDVLNESLLIFEDTATTETETADTSSGDTSTASETENTETKPNDADTQNISDDDVQNIDANFKYLAEFFLWFCPVSAYNSNADKNDPKVLQKMESEMKNHGKSVSNAVNQAFVSGKFDKEFAKIYSTSNPVTPALMQPIVEKLVNEAKATENKNLLQGVFCLAYAENPDNPTKRAYNFFKTDKQIIYISPSEDKQQADQKQAVKDKNEFTQKIKQIIPFDKANIQFNIDDVKLKEAFNGKGEYAQIINDVIENEQSFPNSYSYVNYLTSSNDTHMKDSDKVSALQSLNQSLSKEYPLFVINQTPQGHGALAALGNYQWGGEQDFIDKCFENEQAKAAMLLDDKAPNFAEMEKQALNNSGQPTDGEPTDEPTTSPDEPSSTTDEEPPVEPTNTDGKPTDEPTTPPVEPTEPSSTTDTPPATDTVPQVKQGEEQHIIDDGNLGVKTKQGQGETKLEDPAPAPENTPPPSDETPPSEQPTDEVPQQPEEVKPKVQDVSTTENPETSEKINTEKPKQNNDIRVKSRAQMNAHARQNKKSHMKKGKKKGTESEEEPWIEEEEDPWIKSKLQHFRNKGIM